MKLWAKLNHPNILPFVGFHLSDELDEAMLVSRFEPRGSVVQYLKETKPNDARRLQLVCLTLLL